MTKSAASRLRRFIGCDGLDQARVIVPRSRPARSAYHILLRVMREEGVELGRVRGLLPEPLWPGAESHRHPVVDLGAQLVTVYLTLA